MTAAEIAVRLADVSKSFGNIRAVSDVSFEVRQGEFCTLLGPSGCGKSTLLRLIAGFEVPDRGTLSINDADCTRLPPHRRDTAMVFQGYALFPHRTVLQNVSFGLRMRRRHSRRQIEDRAHEVLDLVGLTGFGGRYPGQLSGGQQQRVALARAIVVRPSVLLLDEPLSALDLKLRRAMRFELKRLQHRTGLTTIFVTHDQEEAMSMSDRIVVMNEGAIEQIGRPEEVYYRPRSRFVGDFIGEANIFRGRISSVDRNGRPKVLLDTPKREIDCVLDERERRFAVGDAVCLIVRAASINLRLGSPPSERWFAARLVEHAFVGASTRYYIRPADSEQIVIADLSGAKSITGADEAEISFCWPLEAAVVVPDS